MKKIIVTLCIVVLVAIFSNSNKEINSESNETLAVLSSGSYFNNNIDSSKENSETEIKKYEHQKKETPYSSLKSFFEINEYSSIDNLDLDNCRACPQLIKQELSNNSHLSIEKVDILLSALQENNEIVNLLIESVILRIKQQGNIVDANSAKIMSKIASFTTLEAAKISIENLKNNNLPIELKNTLIEQIDNTKDRKETADYLMATFKDDKGVLIEVAHPETLALLLQQNDEGLNSFIEESLVENSSQYTPFVFLDLLKSVNNSDSQDRIVNMAQQWAANQLSGSRIEFIEENLSKNVFSLEDKILIEKLLTSAEDKFKSADLLQQYFISTL